MRSLEIISARSRLEKKRQLMLVDGLSAAEKRETALRGRLKLGAE